MRFLKYHQVQEIDELSHNGSDNSLGLIEMVRSKHRNNLAQLIFALTSFQVRRTLLGYVGQPNDIAGLGSYIASTEAHFIMGKSTFNSACE